MRLRLLKAEAQVSQGSGGALGTPITPAMRLSLIAVHLFLVVSPIAMSSRLSAQEQGRPDLSGLPAEEQAMIARACDFHRRVSGPAEYYKCLRGQLAALGVPITPLKKRPPLAKKDASPQARKGDVAALDTGAESAKPGAVPTKPSAPVDTEATPVSPRPAVPTSTTTPNRPPNEKSGSGSPVPLVVGSILLIYLLRLAYVKLKAKPCSVCNARTSNPTNICDSCQSRIDTEQAQRREEQRREAQRQAEEARRREAETWAQEQRRREEEARRNIRTLEDLQRLSGSDFERLIASLFTKDGYTASRRGGSGDEGIDLVLEMGTAKDVVQCKRWKADIGSPVIREFYGSMMHAGARHGFVITTALFTQSAREFVIGKPITLIDAQHLLGWINGKRSSRNGAGSGRNRDVGFDPYEVLGVPRAATKDEIRSAYVKLVAKYHPDKVAHLGDEFQEIAKEKTQAINRAYEMLRGPRSL